MTSFQNVSITPPRRDVAKIVVPDGHLELTLREVFRRMDLPYPKTNEGGASYGIDCVYKMRSGVEQRVYLSVHRPQDSPEYVGNGHFVAGVSGLDCWMDALDIPLPQNGDVEENFTRGLKKIGLTQLIDLKYRPSSVVLAVHEDSPINTEPEFEALYSKEEVKLLGSEFIRMPKNYADRNHIRVHQYKLTRGKTESMLRDHIAEAIIEIAETGRRIKGNNGKIIGALIPKTTPRIVVQSDALRNGFGTFLTDFQYEVRGVIDDMEKEDEYKKQFVDNPLQERLQRTKH